MASHSILAFAAAFGGLYNYAGWYGINVLLRRAGTTQTTGDNIRLLGRRFGSWALPVVLAVVRR